MLRLDIEPQVEASPSNPRMAAPPSAKPIYIEHPILTLERLEWQDERSSGRLWAALWGSVAGHLVLLILLVSLWPKITRWEEQREKLVVPSPEQTIKEHEYTFLELPPSLKQEPPKTGTDIISDQSRRATTRNPVEIKKPREIVSSTTAPGAPGPLAMPEIRRSPPPAQQASSESSHGTPMPQLPANGAKEAAENQLTKLEAPEVGRSGKPGSNWTGALSAGSAIQQAAKAAAESRTHGAAGDFGSVPDLQPNAARGAVEVLSDTLGVDFGPYIQRMGVPIRLNWNNAMPESVNAPLRKSGLVVIDFVVLRTGKVAALRMVKSSGDTALDRAAWAAISASNPFPQLPADFKADSFAFRVRFYYNPERTAQLR